MRLSNIPASDAKNLNKQDLQTELCRQLNDRFRKTFTGGTIVATQGVRALEDKTLHQLMPAIQNFEAFNPDNDPYGEHDFGEVTIDGIRVWFKIDVYDLNMQYRSPNSSDETVSKRVMTLMLPEEY